MASIKFSIRGVRTPTPIYIRFIEGKSQDFKLKTGLFINPKEWSSPNHFPKTTTDENKILKAKLKDLEIQLFKDLNDAQQKGVSLTKDWLQYQIDLFFERIAIDNKSESLVDAIQDFIDTASTRKNGTGGIGLTDNRIKAIKNFKKIVSKYLQNKIIRVRDVDVNFAQSFLIWLMNDQKYNQGFALKCIDNLKTVCRDADLKGIIVNSQIDKIKGGRTKNENIIYLTPNELEKIKQKELGNERLINVRKWLILGCNIGQRVGDLLNITKDNFKTIGNLTVIELEQEKGKKIVLIPVNQQTKEIYESGLPYKISSQRFNNYLKELCVESEIDTLTEGGIRKKNENGDIRMIQGLYPKHSLITSHVCRRTFCTNYYGKMPTNLIMQISGHTTEKMLLSYIGKKAPDYLQEIAHYFALEEQRQQKETKLKVVKKSS